MNFRFIALWLCAACVGMFVVQAVVGTDAVILDRAVAWREPWRFVTSMFAHGDIAHLLSNLFALGLFGLMLEGRVGPRRTFGVFMLAGLLVNVFTPYPRSLGASGAIFGIIGALAVLRPRFMVWAFGVPVPMIVAALMWVVKDVVGLFVPSGIGHLAHLGGVVVGVVVGLWWRAEFGDAWWKKRRHDPALDAALDRWEEKYMGR